MLHFSGLRKRIIQNYFIIIIITVILFEGLFIFYVRNYYYQSIQQMLMSKVTYITGIYNNYMASDSLEVKLDHMFSRNEIVNTDNMGVQIIDKSKKVIIDQYGFSSHEKVNYEDVNSAFKDQITTNTYRVKNTNEHVMSISIPLKVNNEIEGVIRYTVSLDGVDATIFKLILGLIGAGICILLIAISISLKFANTLIEPLEELKTFANELAHGNYNIKLKKSSRISNDEISDLALTFEHMAEEINNSERLKNEFISSVSHELRTPLTSIKGWSETLGYEGITKDELNLGLGIIEDETDRLIKLVEDLLDFSRLSSERIKLQIDMTDISMLVRSVTNQLKVKAMEKNIELKFSIDGELEPIQGDKNRLRQVLINLIQNSIKFTDNDGYVLVDVNQDEELTYIKVIDNGAGIQKENLEKVLDKFFQENYNKSGSGLGLAISNEIIKLHGGEMNIDSEKGVGTTVSFYIKNKLLESI